MVQEAIFKMKQLLVISSAPLILKKGSYFAYSPYEHEMQIWAKYSEEIQFCCPIWQEDKGLLNSEVKFKIHTVFPLKEFNVKTITNVVKSIYYSIINFFIIFKAIKQAHHIHLRCPGNMGLIGAVVQIFFPKKKKTAKYAGNWDSNAKQPFTYKLQRWILSNTFLTKNMQVLVYGEWLNETKNIKPFFTATYKESDKKEIQTRDLDKEIKFLFIGTLSKGKQPLYAIQLVEALARTGKNVLLELYGDGILRSELEQYVVAKDLQGKVVLKGNQPKETVLKAYQESHFLVLPSKSEGWPKVVAEAMFWGCVPIVTPISCVPYMLGHSSRGVLLCEKIEIDVNQILEVINNEELFQKMTIEGQNWSRQFTTDKFETEIKKLLDN